MEIGGVRHLTALLNSKSERCVQEAMIAVSYIVQDSEQNKHAVIADHGCVYQFCPHTLYRVTPIGYGKHSCC